MESHSSSNCFTPVQQNPLPFLCCPKGKIHTKQNHALLLYRPETTLRKFLENFLGFWHSLHPSNHFGVAWDVSCGLRSMRPKVQNATTCWIAVTKKAWVLSGNFDFCPFSPWAKRECVVITKKTTVILFQKLCCSGGQGRSEKDHPVWFLVLAKGDKLWFCHLSSSMFWLQVISLLLQ